MDVDDVVQKYVSGETTQQIGADFGISKSQGGHLCFVSGASSSAAKA